MLLCCIALPTRVSAAPPESTVPPSTAPPSTTEPAYVESLSSLVTLAQAGVVMVTALLIVTVFLALRRGAIDK